MSDFKHCLLRTMHCLTTWAIPWDLTNTARTNFGYDLTLVACISSTNKSSLIRSTKNETILWPNGTQWANQWWVPEGETHQPASMLLLPLTDRSQTPTNAPSSIISRAD